jgi:hypothetical protein
MGTKSNSPILSIAAVVFDIKTGRCGDIFYQNISLDSCMKVGLSPDADTIKWWMSQGDDAKKELLKADNSVQTVLDSFCRFMKRNADYKVWGNSSRFDLGLLENALDKVNMKVPWNFRNERDVRTLVSFAPEIKDNFKFEGTKHSALDDCYHQVGYCSKIFNTLYNGSK